MTPREATPLERCAGCNALPRRAMAPGSPGYDEIYCLTPGCPLGALVRGTRGSVRDLWTRAMRRAPSPLVGELVEALEAALPSIAQDARWGSVAALDAKKILAKMESALARAGKERG